MTLFATAQQQSTSALNDFQARAGNKPANPAAAARATVMASPHRENSYLNKQLDALPLQDDRWQPPAKQAAPAPQSVTCQLADRSERLAASFAMAQLFSAYTLAESIGSLSECVEELTALGAKQVKAGVNASLDEIMACRDTSSGVADLPNKLLRTTLNNFGDSWSEARQIVKKNWQQEPAQSRVGLLQEIWHSNKPLRQRR